MSIDALTTLGWGPLIRCEASELVEALRLGQRSRGGNSPHWEVDQLATSIAWSPGLVRIPASVVDVVAAQEPPVPALAENCQDALLLSVLVAVTALASGSLEGPTYGAWPVDVTGRLRLELPKLHPETTEAPASRVSLLSAVLVASDEAVASVVDCLRRTWPPSQVRAAGRAAYIAALAHPQPARRRQAARKAGVVTTSCWLLPDLEAAFRRTPCSEARAAYRQAHYTIGKSALAAAEPRAISPVRRATHQGRLHRLDQMIATLCAARATGGRMLGVDVALLRRSVVDGRWRIRDEAVADGATSVDLWRALVDAGVRGEITASDKYSAYTLTQAPSGAAGALDGHGRCFQIESPAQYSLAGTRRPGADDPVADELEATSDRRPYQWITPAAPTAEHCVAGGLVLRFGVHDVFATAHPVPAHVVRACGLLYRRARHDVDADSYLDDAAISEAVLTLSSNMTHGGVLLVGSVIDSCDNRRRYTDVDVLQKTTNDELRHCSRFGCGIGPALKQVLATSAQPTSTHSNEV